LLHLQIIAEKQQQPKPSTVFMSATAAEKSRFTAS
jgi:hypothetical protein